MNKKAKGIWIPLVKLYVISWSMLMLQTGCCKNSGNTDNNAGNQFLEKPVAFEYNSSLDSLVPFLLDQCAGKFYEDSGIFPLKYRNIEIRTIHSSKSGFIYMIYGSFFSQNKDQNPEWTTFAFLEHPDYKLFTKKQAEVYFKNSRSVPCLKINLSYELFRRVESLINSTR